MARSRGSDSKHDADILKHAVRWGRNRPQDGDDEATAQDKQEAQRTSARVIRHFNAKANKDNPPR